MQKDFEKEETSQILENLERRQKIKRVITITIITVLLGILVFLGVYSY